MGDRRDIAICRDCGARRVVRKREWIRASRPRCTTCGGPVEISETGRKMDLLKAEEKRLQGERAWNDKEPE